ncbi:RagB/SusD family nutrient uptake outer membrane protein [Sesbania bispinosa]|nr:RagB/SusD family nutrient uptake outer membrane protein [Sesbania bispinosa]
MHRYGGATSLVDDSGAASACSDGGAASLVDESSATSACSDCAISPSLSFFFPSSFFPVLNYS